MRGWVAEHRERIAAQERESAARVDKMRRQHVQNYSKGFDGFCFRCHVVIRKEGTNHEEGCTAAVRPDGKPRRLLIHDWESTTMIVTVNGKQYETELTGWVQRTVRDMTVWTKRVGPEAIAMLHHIEAMQAGIVYEKERDPTLAVPSSYSTVQTAWVKSPAPPRPVYTPRPSPKASVVNLNQWSIEHQLTKEAERLSAPSARADSLRRQHVQQHSMKRAK